MRGFEVRLGGGTSIMPRVAPTLVDFARADDGEYLKIAEACFRIFDHQDWLRVNRARARIKVLVDRDGIDAVRAMVEEELQGDWVAERDFTPDLFEYDEAPFAPGPYTGGASPNGDRSDFDRFLEANVVPQKQEGFSAVTVKITRGDLDPEQFRGLGQIMREFTGGHARTTVQQNLVLRWVRDEALYDVWQRLTALGLGDAGADEITDVVSCPGTDSCKLGITASMGLNKAIQERVEALAIDRPARTPHPHQDERLPERVQPAPHREHRVLRRVDQGRRPHDPGVRRAHRRPLRGRRDRHGHAPEGAPPRQARPGRGRALDRLVPREPRGRRAVQRVRRPRRARRRSRIWSRDLALPVEFGIETMNMFIDWNRSGPFEVIRGEGECAV